MALFGVRGPFKFWSSHLLTLLYLLVSLPSQLYSSFSQRYLRSRAHTDNTPRWVAGDSVLVLPNTESFSGLLLCCGFSAHDPVSWSSASQVLCCGSSAHDLSVEPPFDLDSRTRRNPKSTTRLKPGRYSYQLPASGVQCLGLTEHSVLPGRRVVGLPHRPHRLESGFNLDSRNPSSFESFLLGAVSCLRLDLIFAT